jgi:hypothetical protein
VKSQRTAKKNLILFLKINQFPEELLRHDFSPWFYLETHTKKAVLRILIFVHLDIQKQQQKRGVKKISCPTFFCIDKYDIILFLSWCRKYLGLIHKEFLNFLPQKYIKNIGLGSEIWDPEKTIPDPG